MASEITVKAALSAGKGSTSVALSIGPTQFTLTGTKMLKNRQSIGTTEEALEMGEIASGGWFLCVNRDATNYVQIQAGSGALAMVRLKAGEFCLLRFDSGATPYLKANTAACEVEYVLLEN